MMKQEARKLWTTVVLIGLVLVILPAHAVPIHHLSTRVKVDYIWWQDVGDPTSNLWDDAVCLSDTARQGMDYQSGNRVGIAYRANPAVYPQAGYNTHVMHIDITSCENPVAEYGFVTEVPSFSGNLPWFAANGNMTQSVQMQTNGYASVLACAGDGSPLYSACNGTSWTGSRNGQVYDRSKHVHPDIHGVSGTNHYIIGAYDAPVGVGLREVRSAYGTTNADWTLSSAIVTDRVENAGAMGVIGTDGHAHMFYIRDVSGGQLAYSQNTDPFGAGSWSVVTNICPDNGGTSSKRNAVDCLVAPDGTLWVAYATSSYNVDVVRSTDDGATWTNKTAIGVDGGAYDPYNTFDMEMIGGKAVLLFGNESDGGNYTGRATFEAANTNNAPMHLYLVTLNDFTNENSYVYQDIGSLSDLTGESIGHGGTLYMDVNLEVDEKGRPMFLLAVDADRDKIGNAYFWLALPPPSGTIFKIY